MIIGIDARLWRETGVGRYIRNLVINLEKIDKKNDYVLFVLDSDKEQISEKIKNEKWRIVPTKIKWHSISEQLRFPKIIKKENVDLMHFPYQINVPILYNKPYIITIHDLVRHYFITGKASTNALWLYGFKMIGYKTMINLAAKRANKIIAVSNSTKRDVMSRLGINDKKIEIIYEAADDFFAKNGSTGRNSDKELDIKNYFLYIGNIYPHKNTERLVEAFKIFSKENDTKLIFVGKKDYFYKNLEKKLEKLIREGRIIIYYDISDDKLYSLYKNAICLVRPSLMEGFSLPPLEALSCKCLVLASNISTHKEIFGDSIIYFDPYNTRDIIDKMGYVYSLDKKTRERYIEKGLKLAQSFSWEQTARQTLKVYEDCIGIRQNK